MANSRGIRAGRAYVELGVSDKLTRGLKAAQARLKAFGEGVSGLGVKIAAVGAAGLAPLAGAVLQFSSAGDVLDKMSQRTGIAVESLSELGFAADLSGSNLETLEKGVRKMQQTINDAGRGLATAKDALAELGLTFEELQGMSPEEQFKAIADGISRIEDPTKRAAVAQQILGRAGTALIPLMIDGAAGIEAMQKAARELGLTVSTETAKDAAELNDALGTLSTVAKHVVFVIGSALAPTVTKLAGAATSAVAAVIKWVKANKPLVVTAAKIAATVLAAGLSLVALGGVIVGLGAVLGGVATTIAAVGTAIGVLTSPIFLVVAALAAGTAAFFRYSEAGRKAGATLLSMFGGLKVTAETTIAGISDAITAGRLDLAAEVAAAGVALAWKQGLDGMYGAWIDIRSKILNSMAEWWTGLQSLWSIGVATLLETWANLKFGAVTLWHDVTDYTAKKILEIQGFFDEEFDVDAAKQIIDDTARRREQEQLDALNTELDGINKGLEDKLTGYVDAEKNLKDAIDQNADADRQRYQQELDAARQRLEEAVQEAKAAREQVTPADGVAGSAASGFEDLLDGINESVGKGLSTRGTFNASAVQSLRGSSGPEDRIAAAAETIVKHTKRLVDAATGSKGLVFSGG